MEGLYCSLNVTECLGQASCYSRQKKSGLKELMFWWCRHTAKKENV